MTEVVQQCGDQQAFAPLEVDLAAKIGLRQKLPQKQQGVSVNAQGMLEPRVRRSWIDQANESQLPNASQSSKSSGIDQPRHPSG
jgi:hypothetical protein